MVSTGGAFATVLDRGVAHLTIYMPALALYFIVRGLCNLAVRACCHR